MKISSRSGVFWGIFERYRFHSSCFHAAKPLWFILAAWTGHVSARYCMLYCAWITERTEPEHSEWVLWSMHTSMFLLSSYSDKRVACTAGRWVHLACEISLLLSMNCAVLGSSEFEFWYLYIATCTLPWLDIAYAYIRFQFPLLCSTVCRV